MTDTNKTEAPERIVTRHYSNGIISARPSNTGFSILESNAVCEAEYVRADLSRPAPVTVKPLKWRIPPSEAINGLGQFAVESHNGGKFLRFIPAGADRWVSLGGPFDTIEEARQYGDEWTARILSALTPSPQLTEQEKQDD